MTKLILIFFLLGLQNPIPAWWIGESQPPHEEAKSSQGQTTPYDTLFSDGVFFADFFYGHYRRHHSYDDAGSGQDNSSSNGWIIFLTALIAVATIGQWRVYIRQAKMMRETIDHTKESSERGLRAYVCITLEKADFRIIEGVSDENVFRLRVKNSGQTPAYKLTSNLNWKSFPGFNTPWPEGEPYTIHPGMQGSATTLGAGDYAEMRHPRRPTQEGTPFTDFLARCNRQELTIYYYGTVTYEDVFKKIRFTNFCFYHVTGTERAIVVCNHHNESD